MVLNKKVQNSRNVPKTMDRYMYASGAGSMVGDIQSSLNAVQVIIDVCHRRARLKSMANMDVNKSIIRFILILKRSAINVTLMCMSC